MERLNIKSNRREEFLDISGNVRRALKEIGASNGILGLFVPHTTAAITINEGADPDVVDDILNALEELAPHSRPWKHSEGNSDAHVKASLMGASLTVLVKDGDLVLGTWQKIFFCEFDGPRSRSLLLSFITSD